MKKILIRGRTPFLKSPTFEEFILDDLCWSSIGHLLFSNSMIKTTMTSVDDEFLNIYPAIIKKNINNEEWIEKINSEYKYFLLNYAVLFNSGLSKVKEYLFLIKKLQIPCIIVGCAFQGEIEPNFNESFSFDSDAVELVKAVLDKSASIGVRGEITYDYLTKHLKLPKDNVDIIGCPSMYLFGNKLTQLKCEKFNTKNFIVSFSFNPHTVYSNQKIVSNFMNNFVENFPNYYYIPQGTNELKLMYFGHSDKKLKIIDNFPYDFSHKMYSDKKTISFIDIFSWLDFLRENVSFSFGSRIHGNISSILSGVPAVVIKVDSRVRELAEYHGIPNINIEDLLKDSHLTAADRVKKIYEKADFSQIHKKKDENFNRYINFLRKNSIETIYDGNERQLPCPYDIKNSSVTPPPPLIPLNCVSSEEMSQRLNNYYNHFENKISNCTKKNELLQTELNKANKKIKLVFEALK